MDPIRFPPRLSLANAVPFVVAFGLTFVGAAFLLVAVHAGSPPASDEDRQAAWLIFGFAAFLFLLLVTQVYPWGLLYEVNGDGLFLKRMFLRRTVRWAEVSGVRVVEALEVPDLLAGFQAHLAQASRDRDLSGAFRSQLRMGKAIQFCSVAIVFSGTRGVPGTARTSGRFVVVTLADGNLLLLSPVDVEALEHALMDRGPFSRH